ncbi:MAG: two pore domain potassium channel family protein [Bacteroides sp.]|nr:two pore domain potassium channel family protein [Bacteroides sp.]
MSISDRLKHWFHVISNIRPIVWISSYVALTPIFALIYWALPDGQFRIPDGGTTDFGSWLYYSIVTITTLGFGDYTPMHGWAQLVTAVEVMCGLIILGLFLNAVGSMKSEIDVTSEIEKQRKLHEAQQTDKLKKNIPSVMHCLNTFLAYCYAVTTRHKDRTPDSEYNPDFSIDDMADMYKPSNLPQDLAGRPAVQSLMHSTFRTSLCLDSLQTKVDLELWPDLMEECFSFVANAQVFSNAENLQSESSATPEAVKDLYAFIKENAQLAQKIETRLTSIGEAD